MKTAVNTLIVLLFSTVSFAQQTKVDNSLLLEYYQAQRYQEANQYLKKTFPEPVNNAKVLSQLAYTSQMANKLADAEGYYQRAYDLDSTNTSSLFSMANINLKRGNNQKAEMYYKRVLLKDTTNALVYRQLARIAGEKSDIAGAINYLQKANKINVYDIDIACLLSDYLIGLKQFDQALKILNKAAESDPDDINILLTMLKLTFKEKKWPETIESCKKLIALDMGGDEVLYKLGVSYYNIKNYSCGAEILADISDLGQTEYSYYFAALCYKGLNDQAQAINYMTQAITQGISPNIASYYGEIADSNEKLSKYKKAVLAYQKGLQFSTDDPAMYNALAVLYENQKDKANALLYYRKAVQVYQKVLITNFDPMTCYSLANLCDTKLKDTANAVKYYKKYLDSKPPEKQQTFINYTKSRIVQLQTKN